MSRNFIRFNEILDGEYRRNWEHFSVPTDVQVSGFEAVKQFIAESARGDRKRRILEAEMSKIQNCGIFERLWYFPETGEVEYCVGQERYSEMRTLRDIFDYKKH